MSRKPGGDTFPGMSRLPPARISTDALADILVGRVWISMSAGGVLLGVGDHYLYRTPAPGTPADTYLMFDSVEEIDHMISQLRIARSQLRVIRRAARREPE